MAVHAFSSIVSSLRLPSTASVGVAVSGGRDSITLVYLAKQMFKRVVGITVDHQIRPGSHGESMRAGDIVRSIGVEHDVVSLSWPDGSPPPELHRYNKRYEALLDACQRKCLNVLLTAHHRQNQIETLLYRVVRCSVIDGLAGLLPTLRLPSHPHITICRPLINLDEDFLMEASKGLEWIENPVNSHSVYWRSPLNELLGDVPSLRESLITFNQICLETRQDMTIKVCKVLDSIVTIDSTYGYVKVEYSGFFKLSRPLALRVLAAAIQFVKGDENLFETRKINNLLDRFANGKLQLNTSLGLCNLFHINDKYFGIARQGIKKIEFIREKWTPINVGETVHWDSRFVITLLPLSRKGLSLRIHEPKNVTQFYIRNMTVIDQEKLYLGIRRNKSAKIPNHIVRKGLPVIVDGSGNVVMIPHFKVIDKSYEVTCECKFHSKKTLKEWAGDDDMELNQVYA